MLGKNNTPFAAIAFEQMHRDGGRMAVIAVRASLDLALDGCLTISEKQEVVLADKYEGNSQNTPLRQVSDLVPFKPATDITVQGSSYAPEGKPSTNWLFGIEIDGETHILRSNGYRTWESGRPTVLSKGNAGSLKWRLSAPRALDHVPLDYSFAAGGDIIGAPRHAVDRRNPRGSGVLHPAFVPNGEAIPAAVIDSEFAPVIDPFNAPEPQGLAPVPPWWQWRQRHAGTYDDAWKSIRYPRLPEDFDYRFYQSAHPELIWQGYLQGNEPIRLFNLTKTKTVMAFVLPSVVPVAHFQWLDEREVTARLNLDGVHINMRDDPPWKVEMTWRAWISICPRFFKIDLMLAGLADPNLIRLPVAGENGLEEAVAEPLRPHT